MMTRTLLPLAWLLASVALATAAGTNDPHWLAQPLSLAGALDQALQQNGAILKGKADLESSYGIVVQTKAVAIPHVRATGNYTDNDPTSVDRFPFAGASVPGGGFSFNQPHQSWTANLQVIQSIYEGGRVNVALRSAKLTREQALAQYETVIADTLVDVRVAYYDVLLAAQQITVQEASIQLLQTELDDTKNRFEAGTVPRFNVLRAEVELGNAKPKLIRARNASRVGKNNLATLLGHRVPRDIWEDIPLQLTDRLSAEPWNFELSIALMQALERRPELAALRAAEKLRAEGVTSAKSGYKPSVQLFAGYGARNSSFSSDLTREVDGWSAGAQMSWDIFDGWLTKGKVQEARARHTRATVDLDDTERRVELEVRTAYSNFIEASELLESQKKVQEQAEEALRLATARNAAGTGTQLDVLSAQTALTEARTTQVQALHDYAVARARLERAAGFGITREKGAVK